MMKNRINLDRCILDLQGRTDKRDYLSLRDCFENVFITGSTGSGKTSGSGAALALSLLNCKGLKAHEKIGMVIFLYKSGDAEDWQRWAWQQGRENDLIRVQAGDRNVFNLLEHYAGDEPINAVNALMNIAGLSSGGDRKESEAYWETEQRKRLDRLIRLAKLSKEPLNINTLYRLHISTPNDVEQLTDKEFAKHSYCWKMMGKAAQNTGENHPDFRLVEDYFFREMPFLADRTASSIRSMTSSVLEPFVSSNILNKLFCGGSNLKLEEIFSGKILLLDISVQHHQHLGKIAQTMIGYSLKKAVEQRDLSTYGNPLIFWHDEYQNFLSVFDYQFMSTCRSSRAGSVIMTQNVSNLHAAIGNGKSSEAKVNSLLGLCNTKIFHANNDHITNEYAAKTIGKGLVSLSSVNVSRQSNSTASSSQTLQYLVEPRIFTMLRKGGHANNFLTDAIITGTGRIFSNGYNALNTSFKQHFA